MKICPKCNVEYDDDVSFCRHCGSQLISEIKKTVCPFCKKQLDKEYRFCPYCGKNIPTVSDIQNLNSDKTEIDTVFGNDNPKENYKTRKADEQNNQHNNKKFLAIIAILVLILMIGYGLSKTDIKVTSSPVWKYLYETTGGDELSFNTKKIYQYTGYIDNPLPFGSKISKPREKGKIISVWLRFNYGKNSKSKFPQNAAYSEELFEFQPENLNKTRNIEKHQYTKEGKWISGEYLYGWYSRGWSDDLSNHDLQKKIITYIQEHEKDLIKQPPKKEPLPDTYTFLDGDI